MTSTTTRATTVPLADQRLRVRSRRVRHWTDIHDLSPSFPRESQMRIEDLSAAERSLWDAFPRGEVVDLTKSSPASDDPAQSDRWGADRVIMAEVLGALLVGAQPRHAGQAPAVRLTGS